MDKHPQIENNLTKKRRVNRQLWEVTKKRKERYSSPGAPKYKKCDHSFKTNAFKCSDIERDDQIEFHKNFYSCPNKIIQDTLILKYTKGTRSKLNKSGTMNEVRTLVIKYYIPKMYSKKLIPVCRDLFLSTLLLSKNRVQGVVRRHFNLGASPTEKRGGDRKTNHFMDKKNGVIAFIKKINVIESHYCRSKSSSRVYISSELNIKKLWRIYNVEAQDLLTVKESYFRYIFCTNFNIGFGTPSTDACSTCISFQEKIKHSNCDTKKHELKTELKLHKLKANAFYSKLKENKKDLLIVSFDCQKNQALPRVPDQAAYYSRQLYKYNLTIIIGHSKCEYTKDNVFIYHWDETEHAKGSNEIVSAVYHCLSNLVIPASIKTVRLVADGCGGQNKNSTMMGMISTWFLTLAPVHIEAVEMIFPVVGHSFLPADRVFANIEKRIKRKDVITRPDEYTNLFSDFGTTVSLAGIVYDWKTSVQSVFKLPGNWHFSFNPTKRFLFKKNLQKTNVLIRGEVNYQVETGAYKHVCNKGQSIQNILSPREISTGSMKINPLKLRDVDNLLKKHYGDEWQELDFLTFYKDNIFKQSQELILADEDYGSLCCEENMCDIDQSVML